MELPGTHLGVDASCVNPSVGWVQSGLLKARPFPASVVAFIEPEVRSGIVVALVEDIFAIDLTFDHQLWLPGFCSFNSSQSLLLCSRLAF